MRYAFWLFYVMSQEHPRCFYWVDEVNEGILPMCITEGGGMPVLGNRVSTRRPGEGKITILVLVAIILALLGALMAK